MSSTTNTLPTWEEMSDLDKGAALLHMWKRKREGASYAVEEYPCQYIESPELLALSSREMCQHAVKVCGSNSRMQGLLGSEEYDRLYDLAMVQGEKILDARKLWAVRHANGNISVTDTREAAEFMVYNPSWRGVELLHRAEAGGEWVVVVDARGLEQDSPLNHVCPGDSVLWGGQWAKVEGRGAYERTRATISDRLPTGWVELEVVGRIDTRYYDEQIVRIRRGSVETAAAN